MPSSEQTPRLSVTVLNYNYARYLPACLDSILGQTYRDFELIVIDDRSSDDSLEVMHRYATDPRVRIVAHEQNLGFAGGLIEGTEEHSRGEFLTVISADDLVLQIDAFEQQMAALERWPSAVLAFSSFDRFIDGTGEVYEARRVFEHDTLIRRPEVFRRYMADRDFWAPHSGTILRRSAYEQCGGYPRDVTVGLDFALFAALALEGDFAYLAEPLHGYRNHEGQMSVDVAVSRRNTPEFIHVIDSLCDRAQARGMDVRRLRRDAIRCQLSGLALQDAFSDRRFLALVRTWDLLRRRPALALTSKDFGVAVVRALLGQRVFDTLRGMAHRQLPVRRRSAHTAPAELRD